MNTGGSPSGLELGGWSLWSWFCYCYTPPRPPLCDQADVSACGDMHSTHSSTAATLNGPDTCWFSPFYLIIWKHNNIIGKELSACVDVKGGQGVLGGRWVRWGGGGRLGHGLTSNKRRGSPSSLCVVISTLHRGWWVKYESFGIIYIFLNGHLNSQAEWQQQWDRHGRPSICLIGKPVVRMPCERG